MSHDAHDRLRPLASSPGPDASKFRTLTRQMYAHPPYSARVFRVSQCFLHSFRGCSDPSSTTLNLLSLNVTPATVSVGGAVTLQAIAHLSDGTTQDVTSSTQWTLSNPALATLGTGVLTAKAPGTLTVQAAYVMVVAAGQSSSGFTPQTLSSSAQVTITAAGTTTTTPAITWSTPAAISYGTALSRAQLDAAGSVAGTFTYTPAAGTVLKAGTQTLTAVFTPTTKQLIPQQQRRCSSPWIRPVP